MDIKDEMRTLYDLVESVKAGYRYRLGTEMPKDLLNSLLNPEIGTSAKDKLLNAEYHFNDSEYWDNLNEVEYLDGVVATMKHRYCDFVLAIIVKKENDKWVYAVDWYNYGESVGFSHTVEFEMIEFRKMIEDLVYGGMWNVYWRKVWDVCDLDQAIARQKILPVNVPKAFFTFLDNSEFLTKFCKMTHELKIA